MAWLNQSQDVLVLFLRSQQKHFSELSSAISTDNGIFYNRSRLASKYRTQRCAAFPIEWWRVKLSFDNVFDPTESILCASKLVLIAESPTFLFHFKMLIHTDIYSFTRNPVCLIKSIFYTIYDCDSLHRWSSRRMTYLADQHHLIHCRTTEPVLGQAVGQLWYCPRAGSNPPRCSLQPTSRDNFLFT